MPDKIKVGDTVMMKSGGPTMVVEKIEERTDAEVAVCSWMDKNKQYRETFLLTSLEASSGPLVDFA